MWRIWKLYDTLRAMAIQGIFLFGLAAMIHLILLSTVRFNWLDGLNQAQYKAKTGTGSATPPAAPAGK